MGGLLVGYVVGLVLTFLYLARISSTAIKECRESEEAKFFSEKHTADMCWFIILALSIAWPITDSIIAYRVFTKKGN